MSTETEGNAGAARPLRVTVIGVGGIGSNLAEPVARLLAYHRNPDGTRTRATLTIVDGDTFEDRNGERQSFDRPGNKAESVAARLQRMFPPQVLDIVPFGEYLKPDNAEFILVDGEIVLVCVDNHPTRKFVSNYPAAHPEDIQSMSIISGGNGTGGDGDVFCCYVRDGVEITPPLTAMDPAIAHPTEKAPWEKSCEELAQAGETQLLTANFTAAALMLNALHELINDPEGFVARAAGSERDALVDRGYTHVLFDTRSNNVVSRRENAEWFGTDATVAGATEEEAA